MSETTWRRVSRAHPCPVCGKPDWCLVSADGTAAICPRVGSPRRAGGAGYLHRLADAPAGPHRHVRHVRLAAVGPDLGPLAEQYRAALGSGQPHRLARQLGLTESSLTAIRVGWSVEHAAYSFPMTDTRGRVVGIRLRRPSGAKVSVRGSRAGLHIPTGPVFRAGGRLFIAEGPTDCAALLDLGLATAVGRYSCLGDLRLLAELAKSWQPGEVVIVADADEPGRRGADSLAAVLVCHAPAVRVVVPPGGVKDARDFLKAGGTRADLEAAIATAPVRRLWVAAGRTGQ